MMKFKVYCDGACSQGASQSGADHIGGYAALVKCEGGMTTKAVVGSENNTTNNRMEIMAAIEAFKMINRTTDEPSEVEVVSDSQYLVKGMNDWVKKWQKSNWKTASKKPVKNQDLWNWLVELTTKHQVIFQWTKGHSDCKENQWCDKMAVAAIEKHRKEISDARTSS